MNSFAKHFYLIICAFKYLASANLIEWIPDSSFNNPYNFINREIPCDKSVVDFAEFMPTVSVKGTNDVGELELPLNGEIGFEDGGSFNVGEDKDRNSTCNAKIIRYTGRIYNWDGFDVWNSSKFNEATPDIDRRPCFDDIVNFPEGSEFSIQLPDEVQYISGIRINGKNMDQAEFDEYAMSSDEKTQNFILSQYGDTSVTIKTATCMLRSGCPCQSGVQEISMLCSERYCDVPQCSYPIKPQGHCCNVCGGVLYYEIDPSSFSILEFENLVKQIIEDNDGTDKVAYHISRFPPKYLQLTIVEKGKFEGLSTHLAHLIDYNFKSLWLLGERAMKLSGPPVGSDKVTLEIIFSTLMVVLIVMTGIYVWFYGVTFNIRHTPDVFVRLYNRSNSEVSMTQTSNFTPAVTAFRNPLYSSKRKGNDFAASSSLINKSDEPPVAQPMPHSIAVTRMSDLLAND